MACLRRPPIRRKVYELVRNSVLFEKHFYLNSNPDVKAAGIDPVVHYVRFGSKEGRDPSPFFSETGYKGENVDVGTDGLSSVEHYEQYGRREGRRAIGAASSGSTSRNTVDPYEDIARDIFAIQQLDMSAEFAEEMQETFSQLPLISVIMPVYRTPVQWLRRAVKSLQEQYYGRWELCAVDDCSPD